VVPDLSEAGRPRHGPRPVPVGRLFVILNRGDYWQCGFIITKGTFDELRRAGLPAFRDSVAALVPFAADRVTDIRSWDDVKLLTVLVDRLTTWYRTGLLCLGDAAHAMSPVGGVGINLAIQDAVAAANLLAEPLGRGSVTDDELRRVQRRRALTTRVVQRFQVLIQNRVVAPILNSRARTLTVRSRCASSYGFRGSAGSRPGSSGSASGPSTWTRRPCPRSRPGAERSANCPA